MGAGFHGAGGEGLADSADSADSAHRLEAMLGKHRDLLARDVPRLKELGIDRGDLACVVRHFLRCPWGYNQCAVRKGKESDEWSTPKDLNKAGVSCSLLLQHLEHRCVVGTSAAHTEHVVVDLDSTAGPADLSKRYHAVVTALGAPTFRFQSSASGGVHLYYFLDEILPAGRLYATDGSGLVQRVLAQHGVVVASGRVEIFPSSRRRLRVPFGVGSLLLDEDLIPSATTAIKSLRLVRREFDNGRVEPCSIATWEARVAKGPGRRARLRPVAHVPPLPPQQQVPTAPDAPLVPSLRAQRDARVSRLLTYGLEGPGELNDALYALALSYRDRRRLPEDEARAALVEWLERMHNGHSRTYNQRPAAACRMAEERVRYVYRSRPAAREWVPPPGLTLNEVQALLDATTAEDGRAIRTEDGKGLLYPDGELGKTRFKLLEAWFQLLNRAKSWALTMLRAAHVEGEVTAAREGGITARERMAVRPWWPDVTDPAIVWPMPWDLLVSIKGVSKGRAARIREAGICAGVFTLEEEHRVHVQAAKYRVRVDLAAHLIGVPMFTDLRMALAQLVPGPSDRVALFSEHFARTLAAAAAPAPDVHPIRAVHPYEGLIVRAHDAATAVAAPLARSA